MDMNSFSHLHDALWDEGLMYEWSYMLIGFFCCCQVPTSVSYHFIKNLAFLLQSPYLKFSNPRYSTWLINVMFSTNPKMQGGSTYLLMFVLGCSSSWLSYLK